MTNNVSNDVGDVLCRCNIFCERYRVSIFLVKRISPHSKHGLTYSLAQAIPDWSTLL